MGQQNVQNISKHGTQIPAEIARMESQGAPVEAFNAQEMQRTGEASGEGIRGVATASLEAPTNGE